MNRDVIEANVRLICSVRGISQTGLAGMMGVTRQRVIQIIDRPTERGVAAIAAALGVPVDWLTDPALAGKTVGELRGENQMDTMTPKSWIDGSSVTQFRLSDNRSWENRFSANDFREFCEQFMNALIASQGKLVSLHALHSGQWMNVGNVAMGVFYDGNSTLSRCQPGRFEIRGNGLRFLSVSPEHPLFPQVWAMACNQPIPAGVPTVECRPNECLTEEDIAAGRTITHADMQCEFDNVMRVSYKSNGPTQIRDAIAHYRDVAEQFAQQGGTNGTLSGAMEYLMAAVARKLRMTSDGLADWIRTGGENR